MTGRKNNTPESAAKIRLAHVLAGIQSAQEPPPVSASDFGPRNPTFQPYSGLKNRPNELPPYVPPGESFPPFRQSLPPYEQPGQSLPFARYMQPNGPPSGPYAPPQAPSQPPAPPRIQPPEPPPALPQAGGQGWGGPEPAPGTMPIYDPNTDPRYLPEHWKGAFNNWWER